MVTQLVLTGLSIEPDNFVFVSPLQVPSVKVIISNVPPFLPSKQIMTAMEQYGNIVSKITFVPVRVKNKEAKHVLSFRRQLFIILKLNIRQLEVMVKIKYNEMKLEGGPS